MAHLEHAGPAIKLLPVPALVLGEVLYVHPLLVHVPLLVVPLLDEFDNILYKVMLCRPF